MIDVALIVLAICGGVFVLYMTFVLIVICTVRLLEKFLP